MAVQTTTSMTGLGLGDSVGSPDDSSSDYTAAASTMTRHLIMLAAAADNNIQALLIFMRWVHLGVGVSQTI